VTITNCIKNSDNYNPDEAANFNKLIAKQIFDYNNTHPKDKRKLIEALKLVDKAIILDNKNTYSYINKATIYIKLERYKDAREALQKIIELKKDYPELYLYIGVLYEKQGDLNNANKNYEKALLIFNNQLDKDKKNIDIKFNILFSKIFICSKEEVLDELNKLSEQNIDTYKIKLMKQIIADFDKEEFLNNFNN